MKKYRLTNRELTAQEADDVAIIAKARDHLFAVRGADYYGRLADFTSNLEEYYSPDEIDKTLMAQLAKGSSIDHRLVPCTRIDFEGNHSFGNLVKSLYIEFTQGQRQEIPITLQSARPYESKISNLAKLLSMKKFPCSQSALSEY